MALELVPVMPAGVSGAPALAIATGTVTPTDKGAPVELRLAPSAFAADRAIDLKVTSLVAGVVTLAQVDLILTR